MIMEDEVYPVKPGDWVEHKYIDGRLAKVKDVYIDSEGTCVDLVLYDRKGVKVGRESPACGGPRTYEPACDYANWKRIEEPRFPIEIKWVPDGKGRVAAGYSTGAKVLPDRQWVRPRRKPKPLPPMSISTGNLDERAEAAKMRFAAQNLRDAARKYGFMKLVDDAKKLEDEAERLFPLFTKK
jgi:hypothetical protein